MPNPLTQFGVWLKAALTKLPMSSSRWGWSSIQMGGTAYNYRTVLATAPANAAVMACIRWVARTYPEAPLEIKRRKADGSDDDVLESPLLTLLERPNRYYSGLQLWNATLSDFLLTGNAYWVKLRGSRTTGAPGAPQELWWVPSTQIEPRWPQAPATTDNWIDHYAYLVDGQVTELRPEDVVHFRDGFDPLNPRKGLSPLAALLREIATDDEAANYSASLLRNLGVPGVVLSPSGDTTASEEELEEVKLRFEQRFGGDRRGEPLVLRGPTNVSVLSFNPQQMESREMRRIPEERISAIYGTPAIVVGLGAGLDRSTFANMAEAREAAYESLMIPLQRLITADLNLQLLPDFHDPQHYRLEHCYDDVRVLMADMNSLMERAVKGFEGGVLTRSEARALVDLDADPAVDDVYQQLNTVTWVPADQPPAPSPTLVPAAGPPPPGDGAPAPGPEPVPAAAAFALPQAKQGAAEPVNAAELAAARARWRQLVPASLDGLLDATPRNGRH